MLPTVSTTLRPTMARYCIQGRYRRLTGPFAAAAAAVAVGMAAFHLYTAGFGTLIQY